MYYQCVTPNPFHDFLIYESDQIIPSGSQVYVPYGKKMVYAWVWRSCDGSDIARDKIKKIDSVTSLSLLDASWIAWIERVCQYYHIPVVQFLMQTMPPFIWQALPELPASYLQYHQHDAYIDKLVPGGVLVQDKKLSIARLKKQIQGVESVPDFLSTPFELHESQIRSIDAIPLTGFSVNVLDGPTGSGKTEVYLDRLCALAKSAPVLLMMPEITLTRNMLHRLTERLGFPPWVYHSQMSKSTRVCHWMASAKQLPGLWIGTRSAAFLPSQWGMIIMDEEHDGSYAQSQKMYYSAKHMMLMRSQKLQIPIVLGSATLSLESRHLAKTGVYQSCALERPHTAPVTCYVKDARCETMYDGLLPSVSRAIDRHLKNGHQVLLFLNRRGYAPVLFCKTCSWISECPNCDANMVVHKRLNQLRCHHCSHQIKMPHLCPDGHESLVEVGLGTQRLEDSLREKYPDIRLLRMDQDSTMSERSELEDVLMSEKPAIIIGTQMMSKGIDAPNIRLVVVVQLDQQLLNTSYRSDERAYQLLTQVMGRAARRERSDGGDEVWIQTYFPSHALWKHVLEGKLHEYPKLLLDRRELQKLPPYAFVCQLRLEDMKEEALIQASKRLKIGFSKKFSSASVALYGPFPSGMMRRKNYYHYVGMIKAHSRVDMDRAMAYVREFLLQSKVKWALERDAQDAAM